MITGKNKFNRVIPFLILFICFIFTNVYEDPANIFHNEGVSIARAILDGKEAYFGSGNGDERAVKIGIIEGMPKHVECITLGPSSSFGIRRAQVGTDSYFNLSTSAQNYYDYLGELGLLDIYKIQVDRIIWCVDPVFFSDTFNSGGSRNPDMTNYANYMLNLLNMQSSPVSLKSSFEKKQTQFTQAISLTYFQSSVAFVKANGSFVLPYKRWGIVDESSKDLAHYATDGSYVYSKDNDKITVQDVIESSETFNIEDNYSKGKHISERSKETFIKVLNRLKDQGTEVELFLHPLSPALWDRIKNDSDADKYYILDEVEDFATCISQEYNIRLIGSYNPYNIGASNEDFWDHNHMKHDRLDRYFDFKNEDE